MSEGGDGEGGAVHGWAKLRTAMEGLEWRTRADELVGTIQKVSSRCSEVEVLRTQAEDRYREAEAKLLREADTDAKKDRQITDLRLELAKALRDVEQLCGGLKPKDQNWRKDAGPEVEEQLRYLETETTRWKKESLDLKMQLADERSLTARATRAWQESWSKDLAAQVRATWHARAISGGQNPLPPYNRQH